MKTAGVKHLVELAIARMPPPRSEDVIEDVFLVIERDADLRRTYDGLCVELTTPSVNTSGGRWIRRILGWKTIKQVPSARSKLIGSYSKLLPS
jgi:hypothetical protein